MHNRLPCQCEGEARRVESKRTIWPIDRNMPAKGFGSGTDIDFFSLYIANREGTHPCSRFSVVEVYFQAEHVMERQVSRAQGEPAHVGRTVPLQDVVDVENEIGRPIDLAERSQLEAVDMDVMPSERLEVFCAPRAEALHICITADLGHSRLSVNTQGYRILIGLFSSENSFQDIVAPTCLESLASNRALFH